MTVRERERERDVWVSLEPWHKWPWALERVCAQCFPVAMNISLTQPGVGERTITYVVIS